MRSLSLLLAALCCAPLLALVWLGAPGGDAMLSPAIARFVPDYVLNSLLLSAGTGALALAIGTCTAWLVAQYDFPLRRVLEWALLLPLAVPSYLLAIAYGHQLDVAGPVQASLRALTGWQVGDYAFPPVRSLGGAMLVLALSLYPYVYLTARAAFAGQCRRHFEAAWLAGLPPSRWLWRVAMPMARPALALGVALVMMEALADFGVVSLFGVPTFTTGIYRAWYGLGEPGQAARLALMLLGIVALVIALERASRRRQPNALLHNSTATLTRFQAGPRARWLCCAACALPVLLGFVLPVVQLGWWALSAPEGWADPLHWQAAGHALVVALLAALLALGLALLFAYALRGGLPRWQAGLVRLAALGYAIPGSVIAVAIFLPLIALDKWFAQSWQHWTGEQAGLLLTGSIAAMVLACTIRFLAVAMAGVESGLQQISPRMDDAARLLGARGGRIRRELHWPQLQLAVCAAGFMVFADTLKELPASLLLRPFNVSTLSIRTYELASDGRLVQASVPALMLVGIGLLAVWVLARLKQGRGREPAPQRLPALANPV